MEKNDNGKSPFYRFSNLSSCEGIVHFVSSGVGNVGFTEVVLPEIIQKNRSDLAAVVGFHPDRLVTGQQVHSANVAVVTQSDAGRGAMDKESRLPEADALVTDLEGICLMVLSADCVPVLLYDPKCRVIAAVHAGWRGTAAKIVVETVRMMQAKFNSSPEHILAGIGPSIGKCCFEVGEEVAKTFKKLFPGMNGIVGKGKSIGKYQIDLWAANREELLEAGLQAAHIEIAGMCSVCHPERFFSYRRDGKEAGRFGAGIMLREPW